MLKLKLLRFFGALSIYMGIGLLLSVLAGYLFYGESNTLSLVLFSAGGIILLLIGFTLIGKGKKAEELEKEIEHFIDKAEGK